MLETLLPKTRINLLEMDDEFKHARLSHLHFTREDSDSAQWLELSDVDLNDRILSLYEHSADHLWITLDASEDVKLSLIQATKTKNLKDFVLQCMQDTSIKPAQRQKIKAAFTKAKKQVKDSKDLEALKEFLQFLETEVPIELKVFLYE